MPTMQFTGASVGTIDFNDNVNCQVAEPGWVPAVSKRKKGAMGNQSLYEDVVETIPLRVFSEHATPATARQAVMDWLHDLSAALDQVEEWQETYNSVGAVLFEYKPEDSSLTNPLKATVLGVPEDAPGVLEFQGSYNKALQVFEVFIDLTFRRIGEFLGDEQINSSATVANGDVMTMSSLTATTIPSPTVLKLGKYNFSTGPNQTWGGFVILTDNAANIQIINVESMTTGSFTSVADGGNLARNTNILRYTPPDTFENNSNLASVTIPSKDGLLAVLVNARNSSTTQDFYLRVFFQQQLGNNFFTTRTTIPAGATNPKWYNLGIYSFSAALQVVNFFATVTSLTGSPLLEIDTMTLVRLGKNTHIVHLTEKTMGNWSTEDTEVVFDHQLLTKPGPDVYAERASGNNAGVGRDGNVTFYTQSGLTALYLSTGGSNARHWRRSNSSGTVMQHYATAKRRPAHLVPR